METNNASEVARSAWTAARNAGMGTRDRVRAVADAIRAATPAARSPFLTDVVVARFVAYARNASNYGDVCPTGTTASDRGMLVNMKKAGLVTTFEYERGEVWINFTDAGRAFAAAQGVTL